MFYSKALIDEISKCLVLIDESVMPRSPLQFPCIWEEYRDQLDIF